MPGVHCKWSPSSSYQWLPCPGSAAAPESESGSEAERGTIIHDHGATDKPRPTDWNEEDLALYDLCVPLWRSIVEDVRSSPGSEVYLEEFLLHPDIPDFGGTADMVEVNKDEIHVYDLKTGQGDVSAEKNLQLGCYVALARKRFGDRPRYFGTIVQPARHYIGTYEYSHAAIDDLEQWVRDAVRDPERRAAGGHCRYCTLLPTCDVATDHAVSLLRREPDPTLPPEIARAALIADFEKTLESLIKLSKRRLVAWMENGGKLDAWKLTKWTGRRTWLDNEVAASTLKDRGVPDELLYEEKLRTVTQLEKLGVDIPDELVYKPQSTLTLARSSSHRAPAELDGDEFDAL